MYNWKDMRLRNVRDFYNNIEEVNRLGSLRIWILRVLDDGPKNGAEIMDAIEELNEKINELTKNLLQHHKEFNQMRGDLRMHLHQDLPHPRRPLPPRPPRRPLPGSIYPMLKKMVAEDLITKQEDGRYKLTETGQATIHDIFGMPYDEVYKGETAIENAINQIDSYSSYLEDIKIEKLLPYKEQINELTEKLKKIKKSLHEE